VAGGKWVLGSLPENPVTIPAKPSQSSQELQMSAKDDAMGIVDTFEASGRTGVWTNIRSQDVVAGLRIRIKDPKKIDQAGSLLCGPAAFAFDLATDDPVTYAKAIISLFTGGTGVIGTLLLRPKKDLLFSHFSGGINAVDWILLASLRDSSNYIFDVEEVDDLLGVATLPSTVESWLKSVGYTKVFNETNVWFTKNSHNLRAAGRLFQEGYRIFLFVNSAILKSAKQTNPSLAPDHFVMLQSPIEIAGPPLESLQTASCRVYSWGEEQSVPQDAKIPLKLPDFLLNYYGYLAFKH
jgi:hypothetical protein